MLDNKDKYREICRRDSSIPLFLQAWWMDASCGDEWNVLLSYGKSNGLRGVFVYHYARKMGKLLIIPATLTQYSGPWLFYPEGLTTEARYSFENEVLDDLIEQIEALKAGLFELNFHFSQKYWQPFFWAGYSETSRYTYRLGNISDSDAIYNGMSHRKRQKPYAKAVGSFEFRLDTDGGRFYDLFASKWIGKGGNIFYTKEAFLKIYNAASAKDQGQIFSLYDKEGVLAVSLFVVWDKASAYNLVVYVNENFKSSGASTLITCEVIKYLSDRTECYDFEGSMIKGVALNNQSFGAEIEQFPRLTKISSPLLRLWYWLKH